MKDEAVGTRIGIFDVLYKCDYKSNDGHKVYHVKCCECGYETDMRKSDAKRVHICAHLGINGNFKNFNLYTWENQRIQNIFKGMKSRCYDHNDKAYRWYGEKGIKICDEWMNNPKTFELWAIKNGYDDNLTIDRIDETKNYCPENCRWVTGADNAKYKSTTKLIEVDGETHTGREWADVLDVSTNIINTYIREYGEENTKEFIKKYLMNPGMKPSRRNQSYYDLYMNNNISC